jgi:hypothetical protein
MRRHADRAGDSRRAWTRLGARRGVTGTNYVVAWLVPVANRMLHVIRLDAEGVLVGSPAEVGLEWGPSSSTVASRLGNGALIAWTGYNSPLSNQPANHDIRAIRVGADGTMEGPFSIAASAASEDNPAIASTGGAAQIVYESNSRLFTRSIEEVTPKRRAVR